MARQRPCTHATTASHLSALVGLSVTALGPAVRLLAGLHCGDGRSGPICIRGDGYVGALQPVQRWQVGGCDQRQ